MCVKKMEQLYNGKYACKNVNEPKRENKKIKNKKIFERKKKSFLETVKMFF